MSSFDDVFDGDGWAIGRRQLAEEKPIKQAIVDIYIVQLVLYYKAPFNITIFIGVKC